MLFERHRRLLALVDALGGDVGGLDFQKLLFLYCREVETTPSYEFVPYHFGAFSFTSYADKRRLIAQGLLADEERGWRLTSEGRKLASINPAVRLRLDRFARNHQALRGDTLVAESYRRHPYFATRSEIADRVLRGDALAMLAIGAARPPRGRPGVCTIGYEGRTLEGYLNGLIQDGVTLLCDVRRNAYSHKYGFSGGTLGKTCEGVGLRYEHVPELGIASRERRELRTQSDYDALFAMYERESLPQQGVALARIHAWVREGNRVALTCFEAQPHQCHRHCVAKALLARYGEELQAAHL